MLKVKFELWTQSPEKLREDGLKAEHPRTRERLMALYEVSRGQSATQVAFETKRNPQTVMGWVHKYNQDGPHALKYSNRQGD